MAGTHTQSLREALSAALPSDFRCRVRYAHSPPKRCEPLFSPLPGSEPEVTRLASHFLTVSVPSAQLSSAHSTSNDSEQDVFSYAIEVLAYSTANLATMFVSKADSTGYLPSVKPSPIREISTTFLSWLSARQRVERPDRKLVISLFARAQSQYLFPGSAENSKKHVLDDRQLIKWWLRVLNPLLTQVESSGSSSTGEAPQYAGYITVPGYQGPELRIFQPANSHWKPGNPLRELAETRGIPEHAPTRCLLPRFPDDPKARFMQDLDDEVGLLEDAGALATTSPSKRKHGRWKTIHDLERFWEAMEFRQECSSGRVVGFVWVVISGAEHKKVTPTIASSLLEGLSQESSGKDLASMVDEQTSQDSQRSTKSTTGRSRRKKLTGPIIPRQPRLKGGSSSLSVTSENSHQFDGDCIRITKDGYDQAMQTLLHLDFATADVATKSTAKWVTEVSLICGLPKAQWALDVTGTAKIEEKPLAPSANGATVINDLGGMIKKRKRKQEG